MTSPTRQLRAVPRQRGAVSVRLKGSSGTPRGRTRGSREIAPYPPQSTTLRVLLRSVWRQSVRLTAKRRQATVRFAVLSWLTSQGWQQQWQCMADMDEPLMRKLMPAQSSLRRTASARTLLLRYKWQTVELPRQSAAPARKMKIGVWLTGAGPGAKTVPKKSRQRAESRAAPPEEWRRQRSASATRKKIKWIQILRVQLWMRKRLPTIWRVVLKLTRQPDRINWQRMGWGTCSARPRKGWSLDCIGYNCSFGSGEDYGLQHGQPLLVFVLDEAAELGLEAVALGFRDELEVVGEGDVVEGEVLLVDVELEPVGLLVEHLAVDAADEALGVGVRLDVGALLPELGEGVDDDTEYYVEHDELEQDEVDHVEDEPREEVQRRVRGLRQGDVARPAPLQEAQGQDPVEAVENVHALVLVELAQGVAVGVHVVGELVVLEVEHDDRVDVVEQDREEDGGPDLPPVGGDRLEEFQGGLVLGHDVQQQERVGQVAHGQSQHAHHQVEAGQVQELRVAHAEVEVVQHQVDAVQRPRRLLRLHLLVLLRLRPVGQQHLHHLELAQSPETTDLLLQSASLREVGLVELPPAGLYHQGALHHQPQDDDQHEYRELAKADNLQDLLGRARDVLVAEKDLHHRGGGVLDLAAKLPDVVGQEHDVDEHDKEVAEVAEGEEELAVEGEETPGEVFLVDDAVEGGLHALDEAGLLFGDVVAGHFLEDVGHVGGELEADGLDGEVDPGEPLAEVDLDRAGGLVVEVEHRGALGVAVLVEQLAALGDVVGQGAQEDVQEVGLVGLLVVVLVHPAEDGRGRGRPHALEPDPRLEEEEAGLEALDEAGVVDRLVDLLDEGDLVVVALEEGVEEEHALGEDALDGLHVVDAVVGVVLDRGELGEEVVDRVHHLHLDDDVLVLLAGALHALHQEVDYALPQLDARVVYKLVVAVVELAHQLHEVAPRVLASGARQVALQALVVPLAQQLQEAQVQPQRPHRLAELDARVRPVAADGLVPLVEHRVLDGLRDCGLLVERINLFHGPLDLHEVALHPAIYQLDEAAVLLHQEGLQEARLAVAVPPVKHRDPQQDQLVADLAPLAVLDRELYHRLRGLQLVEFVLYPHYLYFVLLVNLRAPSVHRLLGVHRLNQRLQCLDPQEVELVGVGVAGLEEVSDEGPHGLGVEGLVVLRVLVLEQADEPAVLALDDGLLNAVLLGLGEELGLTQFEQVCVDGEEGGSGVVLEGLDLRHFGDLVQFPADVLADHGELEPVAELDRDEHLQGLDLLVGVAGLGQTVEQPLTHLEGQQEELFVVDFYLLALRLPEGDQHREQALEEVGAADLEQGQLLVASVHHPVQVRGIQSLEELDVVDELAHEDDKVALDVRAEHAALLLGVDVDLVEERDQHALEVEEAAAGPDEQVQELDREEGLDLALGGVVEFAGHVDEHLEEVLEVVDPAADRAGRVELLPELLQLLPEGLHLRPILQLQETTSVLLVQHVAQNQVLVLLLYVVVHLVHVLQHRHVPPGLPVAALVLPLEQLGHGVQGGPQQALQELHVVEQGGVVLEGGLEQAVDLALGVFAGDLGGDEALGLEVGGEGAVVPGVAADDGAGLKSDAVEDVGGEVGPAAQVFDVVVVVVDEDLEQLLGDVHEPEDAVEGLLLPLQVEVLADPAHVDVLEQVQGPQVVLLLRGLVRTPREQPLLALLRYAHQLVHYLGDRLVDHYRVLVLQQDRPVRQSEEAASLIVQPVAQLECYVVQVRVLSLLQQLYQLLPEQRPGLRSALPVYHWAVDGQDLFESAQRVRSGGGLIAAVLDCKCDPTVLVLLRADHAELEVDLGIVLEEVAEDGVELEVEDVEQDGDGVSLGLGEGVLGQADQHLPQLLQEVLVLVQLAVESEFVDLEDESDKGRPQLLVYQRLSRQHLLDELVHQPLYPPAVRLHSVIQVQHRPPLAHLPAQDDDRGQLHHLEGVPVQPQGKEQPHHSRPHPLVVIGVLQDQHAGVLGVVLLESPDADVVAVAAQFLDELQSLQEEEEGLVPLRALRSLRDGLEGVGLGVEADGETLGLSLETVEQLVLFLSQHELDEADLVFGDGGPVADDEGPEELDVAGDLVVGDDGEQFVDDHVVDLGGENLLVVVDEFGECLDGAQLLALLSLHLAVVDEQLDPLRGEHLVGPVFADGQVYQAVEAPQELLDLHRQPGQVLDLVHGLEHVVEQVHNQLQQPELPTELLAAHLGLALQLVGRAGTEVVVLLLLAQQPEQQCLHDLLAGREQVAAYNLRLVLHVVLYPGVQRREDHCRRPQHKQLIVVLPALQHAAHRVLERLLLHHVQLLSAHLQLSVAQLLENRLVLLDVHLFPARPLGLRRGDALYRQLVVRVFCVDVVLVVDSQKENLVVLYQQVVVLYSLLHLEKGLFALAPRLPQHQQRLPRGQLRPLQGPPREEMPQSVPACSRLVLLVRVKHNVGPQLDVGRLAIPFDRLHLPVGGNFVLLLIVLPVVVPEVEGHHLVFVAVVAGEVGVLFDELELEELAALEVGVFLAGALAEHFPGPPVLDQEDLGHGVGEEARLDGGVVAGGDGALYHLELRPEGDEQPQLLVHEQDLVVAAHDVSDLPYLVGREDYELLVHVHVLLEGQPVRVHHALLPPELDHFVGPLQEHAGRVVPQHHRLPEAHGRAQLESQQLEIALSLLQHALLQLVLFLHEEAHVDLSAAQLLGHAHQVDGLLVLVVGLELARGKNLEERGDCLRAGPGLLEEDPVVEVADGLDLAVARHDAHQLSDLQLAHLQYVRRRRTASGRQS